MVGLDGISVLVLSTEASYATLTDELDSCVIGAYFAFFGATVLTLALMILVSSAFRKVVLGTFLAIAAVFTATPF